jgi:hypothetical protein
LRVEHRNTISDFVQPLLQAVRVVVDERRNRFTSRAGGFVGDSWRSAATARGTTTATFHTSHFFKPRILLKLLLQHFAPRLSLTPQPQATPSSERRARISTLRRKKIEI